MEPDPDPLGIIMSLLNYLIFYESILLKQEGNTYVYDDSRRPVMSLITSFVPKIFELISMLGKFHTSKLLYKLFILFLLLIMHRFENLST
jgi:hypothetical protein